VTITGAVDGSGNPASIIQAGTTSTNGIDKIFTFNEDIAAFTTVISNNTSVLDGGGIWWAGHTDISPENASLTKVTITGNGGTGCNRGRQRGRGRRHFCR
jgi:hypothetical protein